MLGKQNKWMRMCQKRWADVLWHAVSYAKILRRQSRLP